MSMVTGQDVADVLGLTYATDATGFDQAAGAADAVMTGLLSNVDHSQHPQCVEATLSVASEMYQARTAVGGQPVALDFAPGPYRLSVWLTRRVASLVGGCMDVRGMVG